MGRRCRRIRFKGLSKGQACLWPGISGWGGNALCSRSGDSVCRFSGNSGANCDCRKCENLKMKAWRIVFTTVIVVWFPTVLTAARFKSPYTLLLPVMGFYPVKLTPFDEGYNETAAYVGGGIFLFLFAMLGIFAVVKKSNLLAMSFAWLLGVSFVLAALRVVLGMYFDISGIRG